jgi:multidrug resistance efflux pump
LTACQANELITTDSVEPIIRHRPFVRLTSLGEGRALDGQIATMSSASEQADCALKELVALYDDAKLRSMIDGVVGKVLVSPGSVVRPGEPMIEIVGKHRFVVVWFPVSRLYRLQVGDAVTVSTGGATCPTKIAKVSVIADALPKEFQNAFAPIDGTRWL